MKRLNKKVAIITGAASGMGATEAMLFAMEGAKVVATDLHEDRLLKIVKEITAAGGDAQAVVHDVTSSADWEKVVAIALDKYGKIDILVNNAGIVGEILPIHQASEKNWNLVIDINLKSVFLGTKAVTPNMLANKSGSIVNISSTAGLTGIAHAGPYTASKGGVRLFSKGSAAELAKSNIRVNSVHPGTIETPLTAAVPDEQKAAGIIGIPMARLGEAIEVANAVLFLASDDATYITGAELAVDGGFSTI